MTSSSAVIDINCKDVTQDFFEELMRRNQPCIVRGCADDPKSSGLHTLPLRQALASLETSNNSNMDDSTNPTVRVEVSPREYEEMPIRKFLQRNPGLFTSLLADFGGDDDVESSQQKQEDGKVGWYLKDWHFVEFWNALPSSSESSSLYQLPFFMRKFAADDDLQKFQRSSSSSTSSSAQQQKKLPQKFGDGHEYKFVYAGGAGSCTLPHFDVCATYSWSLNLSGRKLWRFPSTSSDNEKLLSEFFLRRPPFTELQQMLPTMKMTTTRLPSEENRNNDDDDTTLVTTTQQITQLPGDLIFVPSLWVHQVSNATAVVSVNHNWYCAPYSIPHVMRLLKHEARLAASLVGAETIAMLKRDHHQNDDGDENDDGCCDWERALNFSLYGSGAWSLSVVKNFLKFCDCRHDVAAKALSELAELEKELL